MIDAIKTFFENSPETLNPIWVIVGFLGQAVFASRFIIQWVASERRKRSYIPVIFWYLSILGTSILLAYAIYQRDPVFMAGQSLNSINYVRNIYLIAHHKDRKMGFKFGGAEQENAETTDSPPESSA